MRRRMFCAATALALSISLLPAALADDAQAAPDACSDVSGHWAEEAITKWQAEGYINGYSDGTFRPDQSISRAEFVAFANRIYGFTAPAEISFSDVAPSYWGHEEIQKGVAAGYIQGNEAGRFHPDDTVTRQEAAVMLARINDLPLEDDPAPAEDYADQDTIADWARPYVEAVTRAGIMNGIPGGAFDPQAFMTRGEGVAALDRAVTAHEASQSADLTLTENTLRDTVVEGDLLLSPALGGGAVTLTNVMVKGTVRVQGGGTVTAQGCDLAAVELDQKGVVFSAGEGTSVVRLAFLQEGTIRGQGYECVVIAAEGVKEAAIDGAVETVELGTGATVTLSKDAAVGTLTVTEGADGGKVALSRGASVDEMEIRGEVRITGQGDVSSMTVYVPGVTSSVKPDHVEVKEDGKTPSYTGGGSSSGGGSSGGGGSSSGDDDGRSEPTLGGIQPSAEGVKVGASITLAASITGDMDGCSVHWTVDDAVVAELSQETGTSITLTGKTAGSVTVTAELRDGGGKALGSKTISLSVTERARVTAITLEPGKDAYALGDVITATAELSGPLDGETVSWFSSDSAYAVVTADPDDSTKALIEIVKWDTTSRPVAISAATGGQDTPVERPVAIEKFVPVTGITGVPESVALNKSLTLTGTVSPADATYQDIAWEIVDGGEVTGAAISENTLTATGTAGAVTVRATIAGGALEGDYVQEFPIHVGPWIKELIVDTTAAPAGTERNVTVVIEHPENGYRVRWNASSSEIEPTYDNMDQTTERYYATATLTFPNKDEAFSLTANVVTAQSDTPIDSKSASIPGVASIEYVTTNDFQYDTFVYYGENTLRTSTDWSGTILWSLEVDPALANRIALSSAEGETVVLTVAKDVPADTQITVTASSEGNTGKKGTCVKQYTEIRVRPNN